MTKALTLAAVFAVAALAQPAFAGGAEPTQLRVSSSHVDFSDPVAVKEFYARLSRVAARVCDSNSSNPSVTQQDRVCADQALMLAVRNVNQPMLTQLHDRIHVRNPSALASN